MNNDEGLEKTDKGNKTAANSGSELFAFTDSNKALENRRVVINKKKVEYTQKRLNNNNKKVLVCKMDTIISFFV
jgi:hypothetical protein